MYPILLAVDEDEDRARRSARAVIDLPGDPGEKRVRVLHSFTDNPAGASATQVESVRVARDLLREAGVDVEIDESSGDPAGVVLDVAREMDAKMIIVAGRRRSPAGKAVFGSVTQSVILDADRPVLVAEG